MKITVIAKPKKKREFIKQVSPFEYIVSVKEPPVDGKANQAIIDSLSKYFQVSRAEILLVGGQAGKTKTFDIPDYLKDFEVLPKQKHLF